MKSSLFKTPFLVALVFLALFLAMNESRIHHLVLNEDGREQVTISTFGYLKNGILQVKVNKLSIDPSIRFERVKNMASFSFKFTNRQN